MAGTLLSAIALAPAACGPSHPVFHEALILDGVRVEPSVLERGRALYRMHCEACHGADGDGQGPAARGLKIPPRSFVAADFLYKSTPEGALPTHADVVEVIRVGRPTRGMPAWFGLGDEDLDAVARYVETFSPRWRESGRPEAQLP